MNMSTLVPSEKVTAGGIGSAAMYALLLVLNQYFLQDNPIGVELGGALIGLAGLAGSYFRQPGPRDVGVITLEKE